MTQNIYDKNYYEQRGLVRYTLIFGKTQKNALVELTKKHDLAQSDVLEVLIDMAAVNDFSEAFKAKRESKKGKGDGKKDVVNMLKGMSDAELEKARELLAGLKKPT